MFEKLSLSSFVHSIGQTVNYVTAKSTKILGKMAVIYSIGSLLNNPQSYAQETSLLNPLGLMALSSFLPMIEGQVPSPEFLTVFGGGAYDLGSAIITTASDDIVLAGQTNGFGASNYDVLVSMLYANGSLAWSHTLGGASDDLSYGVTMTNGSIIVVGTTASFGVGGSDVLIANLYANGSLAWIVTLGGSIDEQGYAVTTTVSGDIVITGDTSSFGTVSDDVLVAKLYANGSVAWARALGGTSTDYGRGIITTVTDDIVVMGRTNSFVAGSYNLLVTKLYSNGSLAWMRSLGGSLNEQGYALTTTASGDIVVLGYTTSFGAGGEDALLVKLYANGSLAWARTLGGGLNDEGYALTTTANDDIVLVGTTFFGAGNSDILLAQFFADGTLAWARTLGGIAVDTGNALKITALGDIVISGYTYSFGAGNSDILVARLAANGTFLDCNLTSTASLTVLDWPNITNTLVTPTIISINTTGLVRNWTTVSTQFIAPQVLSLCNASISSPSTGATSALIASSSSTTFFSTNPSSTSQTSASTATNVVSSLPTPSPSSSLSSGTNASFISTGDSSAPSALTNSPSSSLPVDTSNTAFISTTVSAESSTSNNNPSSPLSSDTSTALTNTALISTTVSTAPSTSSNNPSSSSTNVPSSQSSASITFSVSVRLNSIVIERGTSTTLTSDSISLSGNASPDQVLFTVQGDNPGLILTVNGVETTQFTYQDILDNFVEVELSGTCDPAPEISLQVEVPGSQSPPNRLTLFFASTSTNCNHAARFGNDGVLFSSAGLLSTTGLGFLAKRREVEPSEETPAQVVENTMSLRH